MERIVETVIEYTPAIPCKTAAEMEEICCAPTDLLQCCETVEVWDGYTQQEVLDALGIELDEKGRDKDGHYVVIEFAPRKKPCGEKVTKYDTSGGNCCDEIAVLEIDHESTPDILPAGTNIVIYANGGQAPYRFKTTANKTYFSNGQKEIVTNNPYVTLNALSDFCGATSISVTDGCTSDNTIIRSSLGSWALQPSQCVLGGVETEFGPDSPYWEATQGMYWQMEYTDRYLVYVQQPVLCPGWVVHCTELPAACALGEATHGDGDTCLALPDSYSTDCVDCDSPSTGRLKCSDSSHTTTFTGGGANYHRWFTTTLYLYKWEC